MAIKISISNYSSNSAETFYKGTEKTVEATCNACGHLEKMLNVTEMKGGAKCPVCGGDKVSVKIY